MTFNYDDELSDTQDIEEEISEEIERKKNSKGKIYTVINKLYFNDDTICFKVKNEQEKKNIFMKFPLNEAKRKSMAYAPYEVAKTISNGKHLERLIGHEPEKFGQYFAIVAQLADINLLRFIQSKLLKKPQNQKEEFWKNIAMDSANGFSELHKNLIIHGDPKSSNLILYKKEGIWAWCDLSTKQNANLNLFNGRSGSSSHIITYNYCPPEMTEKFLKYKRSSHDFSSDIFGLMMTLYQVLDPDGVTIAERSNAPIDYDTIPRFIEKLKVNPEIKKILNKGLLPPVPERYTGSTTKYRYTNAEQLIRDLRYGFNEEQSNHYIKNTIDIQSFLNLVNKMNEMINLSSKHTNTDIPGLVTLKYAYDLKSLEETILKTQNDKNEIKNHLDATKNAEKVISKYRNWREDQSKIMSRFLDHEKSPEAIMVGTDYVYCHRGGAGWVPKYDVPLITLNEILKKETPYRTNPSDKVNKWFR